MHLHLFNSDNDLALANGDENYTPPASVRKMMEDLALLPVWYSSPGTYSCASGEVSHIMPWGWNPAFVKQLRLSGLPSSLLPTREQLDKIKELSHRTQALRICNQLNISEYYCGAPTELFSYESVTGFFASNPICILKSPLSGSGRGLFICRNEFSYFAERWCLNTLKKQKSIIAEALFNRTKDFAMQFYSDGEGTITFVGYSIFETDDNGVYKRNLLVSDSQIENILSEFISLDLLLSLKKRLIEILTSEIAPHYNGFLGVDMMVCQFDKPPYYRIHPCVEINLRTTMGLVARRIHDNHIAINKQGYFFIDYYTSHHKLLKEHLEKKTKYPLTYQDGRVSSGYMPLTPILRGTKYVAYMIINAD